MGYSVTYNADTVIMWTSEAADKHYLRPNPATGTMIISKTPDYESQWSKVSSSDMKAGSSYAANYKKPDGTNAYSTTPTFTASGTLYASSDMITYQKAVLDASTGTFSLSVQLRGWGHNGDAGGWPNVTVKLTYGSTTKTISGYTLYQWQSISYKFTGIPSGANCTITVVMTTPGYTLGSVSGIYMPTSCKVTYNHTNASGSVLATATAEYVKYGDSVTLADKSVSIAGYSYSYAIDKNYNTVTAPTIYAAVSYWLIYKSGRPDTFAWTYAKTQGAAFNLTAAEWNALAENINEVREYKSLSDYSFTTAVKGNNFTAAEFNQAVAAIRGISTSLLTGYITSSGAFLISKGDTVKAQYLNDLVTAINSV